MNMTRKELSISRLFKNAGKFSKTSSLVPLPVGRGWG
jgi:hypothetical protein